MARNENYEEVANQFLGFYYEAFDGDRSQLRNVYRESSKLSFLGENFAGGDAIMERLANLSFQKCRHDFKGHDVQPSGNDSIMIFVIGDLYPDEEVNPLKFAQCFCLREASPGDWYVENDMFQLNIG